jgi:hypothetical protein
MHCCARNIGRLTRIPKLRTELQSRFLVDPSRSPMASANSLRTGERHTAELALTCVFFTASCPGSVPNYLREVRWYRDGLSGELPRSSDRQLPGWSACWNLFACSLPHIAMCDLPHMPGLVIASSGEKGGRPADGSITTLCDKPAAGRTESSPDCYK